MLISDFVKRLQQALAVILSKPEMIAIDKGNLIADESGLSIIELRVLLNRYANSAQEATENNLKPFIDLLKSQALRRIKTDAIICHNFLSHGNQALLALAEVLKKATNLDVLRMIFPGLHPDLTFDKSYNKYIPSDDGKTLIDVEQCFVDAMARRDGKFMHTHPVVNDKCVANKGKFLKELTESEIVRLKAFVGKANALYQRIINKQDAKTQFKRFHKQMGQPSITIGATYGNEGAEKLGKDVALLKTNLSPNLDDVFSLLEKYSRDQWKRVLCLIPYALLKDSVLLKKYSPKATYKDFVEKLSDIVESPLHYKIGLICALFVYEKERSRLLDYTKYEPSNSYFGALYNYAAETIAYRRGSPSKDEKITCTRILIDYLIQENPGNFDVFFAEKFKSHFEVQFKKEFKSKFKTNDEEQYKAHYAANYQKECDYHFNRHKTALVEGDVGDMYKQVLIPFTPVQENTNQLVVGI